MEVFEIIHFYGLVYRITIEQNHVRIYRKFRQSDIENNPFLEYNIVKYFKDPDDQSILLHLGGLRYCSIDSNIYEFTALAPITQYTIDGYAVSPYAVDENGLKYLIDYQHTTTVDSIMPHHAVNIRCNLEEIHFRNIRAMYAYDEERGMTIRLRPLTYSPYPIEAYQDMNTFYQNIQLHYVNGTTEPLTEAIFVDIMHEFEQTYDMHPFVDRVLLQRCDELVREI